DLVWATGDGAFQRNRSRQTGHPSAARSLGSVTPPDARPQDGAARLARADVPTAHRQQDGPERFAARSARDAVGFQREIPVEGLPEDRYRAHPQAHCQAQAGAGDWAKVPDQA
ncbi:MAG: hypothetical protein M3319_16500, partial [Actinomycetota bacterium]|nr:hypothetical protein [Actinomycetota bacterium]